MRNRDDAYNNFLKLPSAGYKYRKDGKIYKNGESANIWSSSIKSSYSKSLYFSSSKAEKDNYLRANGASIRCIKK